jgi:hypothetical protein
MITGSVMIADPKRQVRTSLPQMAHAPIFNSSSFSVIAGIGRSSRRKSFGA